MLQGRPRGGADEPAAALTHACRKARGRRAWWALRLRSWDAAAAAVAAIMSSIMRWRDRPARNLRRTLMAPFPFCMEMQDLPAVDKINHFAQRCGFYEHQRGLRFADTS